MSRFVATITMVAIIATGCSSGSGSTSRSTQPPPTETAPSTMTKTTKATTVETKAFSLAVPEGVVNESKRSEEEGSILLNYRRPYGAVKLEVFLSELDLGNATVTRKGKVVQADVMVDGRPTTRIDVDLSDVIRGPSAKDLLRYTIDFEKIPQPSEQRHTVFSIALLSKQDVAAADVAVFKAEAQEMIDSLAIK